MTDGRDTSSDEGLTLEELKEAMQGQRALAAHLTEIQQRMFDLLKLHGDAERRGEAIEATVPMLVEDIAALLGYTELLVRDNERFVAFLIGLEEAGTISRGELEFLMALRSERPGASNKRGERQR